ncbi:hypothetical protein EV356DRAFT_102859 [Viridothelium virens]|uniref:Uncharacterized protein n=1 Tax=Viridothelium virens TaxID=1048519 RepID=A0A6A6HNU8_VIRVR|nr:hypothetical protein EV356DRAFT_102859 [Viridothelium virens]
MYNAVSRAAGDDSYCWWSDSYFSKPRICLTLSLKNGTAIQGALHRSSPPFSPQSNTDDLPQILALKKYLGALSQERFIVLTSCTEKSFGRLINRTYITSYRFAAGGTACSSETLATLTRSEPRSSLFFGCAMAKRRSSATTTYHSVPWRSPAHAADVTTHRKLS